MGLMQQAYDTYCAMESQYAGIYGKAKEPLVPVSHQIVNAELELTLDADGHLLDARSVEAEQAATIIPVTESSSGRTGKAPGAHPLCDQIQSLPAVSRQIRKLPDTAAPLGAITLRPPQALRHRPLCGKGNNRNGYGSARPDRTG